MSTEYSSTTLVSNQPLFTVRDAAKLFSVSVYTLRSWITAGELKSLRVGGSIRLSIEDLQAFVKANEQKRAGQAAHSYETI